MRKLIVLAVVAALALMAVPAAFAGNGNGKGDGNGKGNGGHKKAVVTYTLSGDVTAVDAVGGVVSVTVVKANAAARSFKGKTVDLKVTDATLFYERTADGERVAATLADISVGDRITSNGKLKKATGAFTAKRITIALPVGTCLSAD